MEKSWDLVRSTSTSSNTGGWYQIEWIFNGCIRQQQHHPHHWWTNMGGAHQKRGTTGNPHNIPDTSVLRTTEMVWHHFSPQTIRRRLPLRIQDTPGLVHPNLLSTGRPPPREINSLYIGHQVIPILEKNKTAKLESLLGKLNHAVHIIPPARYFLNIIHLLLKIIIK